MSHRPPRSHSGFTIAEMLVVLGIVLMLMALAASGFRKSWESQEIRTSAQQLMQDMALAQHMARKLGKPVELRLYRYMALDVPMLQQGQSTSNVGLARGYQLLVTEPDGRAFPLFPMTTFEGATILSQNRKVSTVVPGQWRPSAESSRAAPGQPPMHLHPELGIGPYEFVAIEFRPNGTTNLDPDPTEPWTLTLGPGRWAETPDVFPSTRQDSPIRIFNVITIDPSTGATKLW